MSIAVAIDFLTEMLEMARNESSLESCVTPTPSAIRLTSIKALSHLNQHSTMARSATVVCHLWPGTLESGLLRQLMQRRCSETSFKSNLDDGNGLMLTENTLSI